MLREIESLNLVFLGDSQSDRGVHDLQDDQRSDCGESPGDYNPNELIQQLMSIAFEQTRRKRAALRIFEDRIHCA